MAYILVDSAPMTDGIVRYWKHLGQYQLANGDRWWPHTGNANLLQGAMYGIRSDDQKFFRMMECAATASDEIKRGLVAEASKLLNTFLLCGCRDRIMCDVHKASLPAPATRNEGDLIDASLR